MEVMLPLACPLFFNLLQRPRACGPALKSLVFGEGLESGGGEGQCQMFEAFPRIH